jgi:anaerobic ribonucleoside-triphosphate reductase activating protein
MEQDILRVHHIEPASLANGPGRRFVIWVQGCSLGCPGCFNPDTHSAKGGARLPVLSLGEQVLAIKDWIEGITISGGEPFQLIPALIRLLQMIKQQSELSVVVFSGFTWTEIQRIPGSQNILAATDILLAGRYQAENRLARGLLGSANKTAHFLSERYTIRDLDTIPEAELFINVDGSITATGIDPFVGGK